MLCSRSASDQDDAHVACHREQHLAEVLGLGIRLGLELDAVELGQTVDGLRDRLAEALGDLLLGTSVSSSVVQQRRHHRRLGVELPVGDDLGDRDRVRDMRITALAELPWCAEAAELVGLSVRLTSLGR
jgi:hypothetical protein